MSAGHEIADLDENLADLRKQSLKIVALIVAATGYAWFIYSAWPDHNGLSVSSTWIGIGLLLAGASASLALHKHALRAAIYLLVVSALGAVSCAVLSFPLPTTGYLFVLPVILSSVLIDRPAVFAVGIAASAANITLNAYHGVPLQSSDVVLPSSVILLVSVASWLSVRNLHIAFPDWQHIPVIVVSGQDEVDYQEPMAGAMVVTKQDGLMPGEIVQWVQNVANSAITLFPMRPVPRATPVP